MLKLLTLFLFNLFLYAKSSVWIVENNLNKLYLGGTIHLLKESDYPLPKEFFKAYKNSDIIVFETDINISKREAQKLLLEMGTYPADVNIKDKISPKNYKRLQKYCEKIGFPLFYIEQLKLPLALTTLITIEEKKRGYSAEFGVDNYFYKKAIADKKEIETFETPKEQMEFIVKMGEGKENEFIEKFFEDVEKNLHDLDKIIKSWKKGDNSILIKYLQDFKKYPSSYQNLLVKRNSNWLKKIEKYLKTPKVEFILVGTAHLIGKDGLITKLRNLGYRVKRVE